MTAAASGAMILITRMGERKTNKSNLGCGDDQEGQPVSSAAEDGGGEVHRNLVGGQVRPFPAGHPYGRATLARAGPPQAGNAPSGGRRRRASWGLVRQARAARPWRAGPVNKKGAATCGTPGCKGCCAVPQSEGGREEEEKRSGIAARRTGRPRGKETVFCHGPAHGRKVPLRTQDLARAAASEFS